MSRDYYLGEESLIIDEYQSKLNEIDEYWDRENQYIKSCGIYTPEEVEQILANHEEIRRSKKKEIKKKYDKLLGDYREQTRLDRTINAFGDLYMEDELDDLEYDMLESDTSYDDAEYYQMLREMKEERDAYDDYIASLDMNEK